jgi:ribosomal protein L37AE/L43A
LHTVGAAATVPSARRRSRHATLRHEMRVTITCEECGERHRLERRVSEPGPIWIVCHNCELPLQAVLDGVTSPTTAPAAQPSRTPSAWAGVVDFRAA